MTLQTQTNLKRRIANSLRRSKKKLKTLASTKQAAASGPTIKGGLRSKTAKETRFESRSVFPRRTARRQRLSSELRTKSLGHSRAT